MKNLKPLYLLLAVLLACTVGSCKKDKDDTTSTFVYTTSTSSTLVSTFKLNNTNITSINVSKVFFTIDPERSMIYNADSLPMGTDISKMKAEITFRSPVKSAVFHVMDNNKESTDYEYKNNSSDSLDFRYGVTLTVTSADGLNTRDYVVKVNVHKQETDTIVWPASERRNLPGAADDNYAVSTTHYNEVYWCLLHNNNGYYLSTAANPAGTWDVQTVEWGFEPDARSLSSTSSALYVLDGEGNLYSSTDGATWTATGEKWTTILGRYEDRLLGISAQPYCYAEYPRRADFTPEPIDEKFPVKGMSQLMAVNPSWSTSSQAIMVGGVQADGSLTSATWGYDGNRWATLNAKGSELPALEGPVMFAYYNYQLDATTEKFYKRDVWMVMGGREADGSLNVKTYLSYNWGITWAEAKTALCQPTSMPAFYGAQAHVYSMEMKKNQAPMRRIAQKPTVWDCPYIFIFGGYNSHGLLHNSIWQGVYVRMSQYPVY